MFPFSPLCQCMRVQIPKLDTNLAVQSRTIKFTKIFPSVKSDKDYNQKCWLLYIGTFSIVTRFLLRNTADECGSNKLRKRLQLMITIVLNGNHSFGKTTVYRHVLQRPWESTDVQFNVELQIFIVFSDVRKTWKHGKNGKIDNILVIKKNWPITILRYYCSQ